MLVMPSRADESPVELNGSVELVAHICQATGNLLGLTSNSAARDLSVGQLSPLTPDRLRSLVSFVTCRRRRISGAGGVALACDVGGSKRVAGGSGRTGVRRASREIGQGSRRRFARELTGEQLSSRRVPEEASGLGIPCPNHGRSRGGWRPFNRPTVSRRVVNTLSRLAAVLVFAVYSLRPVRSLESGIDLQITSSTEFSHSGRSLHIGSMPTMPEWEPAINARARKKIFTGQDGVWNSGSVN